MNEFSNKYKLISKEEVKEINGVAYVFSHNKTKARVLFLVNDDVNKTFSIGFKTPPTDDTGLPHILEHSVLCGSRKFPVKEPFVELMKGSLNTFLNAMTFPDKTVYPVASCNDKDFKNLVDVYMDAVLYPNIYKKKQIFEQEGWHYELNNKDEDLIYNGVVYNEMKGSFSNPDSIVDSKVMASLFPDNCYGCESGGDPKKIVTLTLNDFLSFHKKYYHPTNSYTIFYGKLDINEKLDWIDKEYFSNFDEISLESNIEIQEPFDKAKDVVISYPIGKEQDDKDKTYLNYTVSAGTYEDTVLSMGFNILNYVLITAPGAILKQALLDKKIGNDINGVYQDGILQPMFSITAKGANKEQKDDFVNTINETLMDVLKNGIDKESLLAAINYYEFAYREAEFNGLPKGLVYSINCLSTWLYDDTKPYNQIKTSEVFETLKEKVNTNYFEELIKDYILDNNHKVLLMATPDKELGDIEEAKVKKELSDYKNSLNDEKLDEIIQETKALKDYQSAPSKKEDLATIPLLSKDDLSKEALPLINEEKEVNGVKVVHHDLFTNDIAYIKVMFDTKNIDDELVPALGLLSSCLGRIDTKNYNFKKLDQIININSGGISFNNEQYANKDVKLYISASTKVTYDKQDFAFDILDEIIHTSKLDDEKRLFEIICEEYGRMQGFLLSAGHRASFTRALSYVSEAAYRSEAVSGIRYFKFIENLVKNFEENKQKLIKDLKTLQNSIFRKDNVLVSYTANLDAYKTFSKCLNKFSKSLNNSKENIFNFTFVPNKLNEGFKAPINVQFVATVGNFVEAGFKYTGAFNVFNNIIVTDYLWLNIRVKGGAYGCMSHFTRNGVGYFLSYRDPNLGKTLEVYKGVVDFLENFEASEEEMTKGIIGAIGELDYPQTPSMRGNSSLNAYLNGVTQEDIQRERLETINCTPEEIRRLAPAVKSILDQDIICVVGNENKLESEKELFTSINNLFL